MGAVAFLTQQVILFCFLGVCSVSGLPRGGEGCAAAVPILCGCVSELCWTFGGAPGALQVVTQVPEAEWWCFP